MRNFEIYLYDIKESLNKILKYTEDMTYDEFIKEEKTIDAVIRNLEIIGEASKYIPDNVMKKYPGIDWIGIKGMRNILIHEYFGVDLRIIWKTIKYNLSELRDNIEKIIKEIENK